MITGMPDFEESLFGATSRYRVHETNSFPFYFYILQHSTTLSAKEQQRVIATKFLA
jgi:hypothetical protein